MTVITSHSSVSDLISAGVLKVPVRVVGEYNGKLVTAIIEDDGCFVHSGTKHHSPSVAAGKAITKETGSTTPGRSYFSINGWKFWCIILGKNSKVSLAEIRRQAIST